MLVTGNLAREMEEVLFITPMEVNMKVCGKKTSSMEMVFSLLKTALNMLVHLKMTEWSIELSHKMLQLLVTCQLQLKMLERPTINQPNQLEKRQQNQLANKHHLLKVKLQPLFQTPVLWEEPPKANLPETKQRKKSKRIHSKSLLTSPT